MMKLWLIKNGFLEKVDEITALTPERQVAGESQNSAQTPLWL
jgi:hypothetical protein